MTSELCSSSAWRKAPSSTGASASPGLRDGGSAESVTALICRTSTKALPRLAARLREIAQRVLAHPPGRSVLRLPQASGRGPGGDVKPRASPPDGAQGPAHRLLHEVALVPHAPFDEGQEGQKRLV